MLVSRRIFHSLFACLISCCAASVSAQSEAQRNKPEEGIRALVNSLTEAFNAHDAKGMASHWQADGVHTSAATGAKLVGRQALSAAYRKLFAADPKCEIALGVSSVRKLGPDVVSADCTSAMRHTDGSITRSQLNAVLVKRDGDWWIAQVQETDLPDLSAGNNPLLELDWLVGRWSDDSHETQVTNDFSWSHNGRFLTRQFRQVRDGELVRGGTQMFGWDPNQRTIRCWLFLDDGSYGEGVCTSEGDDKWVVKLSVTLADGRSGSLKQVVHREGADLLTVQTIDRELNGAAQPNGAVATLERQPGGAAGPMDPFGEGGGDGGGGGFF